MADDEVTEKEVNVDNSGLTKEESPWRTEEND